MASNSNLYMCCLAALAASLALAHYMHQLLHFCGLVAVTLALVAPLKPSVKPMVGF